MINLSLLLIIIILFSYLYNINKRKENLISPKLFTKGILLGDNTLEKEIKLLRNMDTCIKNKNDDFYGCINSLNIRRKRDNKIIKKKRNVDYIKSKKTSDLELQSFDL